MKARLKAVDPSTTSDAAKELLDGVQAKLGITPNLHRTMANAPAVLEGYLNFSNALTKGSLSARLREQIALAVSQANSCDYCLAAHSAVGKALGLNGRELLDSRLGQSADSKTDAALKFARRVVSERGSVSDDDLVQLRKVGFGDGEIAEILANVALNIFTNYFNHVAGTELDFPKVSAVIAA